MQVDQIPKKPATGPWNDWYHVTVHVYGSWLRGDPRGWRSRHHREHVEGDYKNPPPKGKYDNLYELSKALMKRDAVKIKQELRQFVANAIAEKLRNDGIEVLIVSMDQALARPRALPRSQPARVDRMGKEIRDAEIESPRSYRGSSLKAR